MTREQARKNLEAIGIAEVTDEQISAYLNQFNGEAQNDKRVIEKLKGDSAKMVELQAKLDALNEQNLSDIEKANKATETANSRVAELEKQIKNMETRSKLAELGIKGEHLDKFYGENGEVDFSVLGQILSESKASGATERELELASKASNPNGGSKSADVKTEAEKYVTEHLTSASNFDDSIKSYL